ncbi:MAG TPA: L-rhamnose mutarotase, partial [Rhodothermales bacterium]|nr:L-rhamnose mutarotase [Rhodothermales bacterium]
MESNSESLRTSIEAPPPVHGPTNPESSFDEIQRFAAVVELKPEKEQLYRELHAEVWPGVVQAVKNANINNYSIFVASIEGRRY